MMAVWSQLSSFSGINGASKNYIFLLIPSHFFTSICLRHSLLLLESSVWLEDLDLPYYAVILNKHKMRKSLLTFRTNMAEYTSLVLTSSIHKEFPQAPTLIGGAE